MKILFCASTAVHIHNFHLPYISHYRKQNWEVHVLASGFSHHIDVHRIYDLQINKKVFSAENIRVVLRMAQIFKTEQYDLISVHTTLAAALCRFALMLSGAKKTRLAYTCHGYFFAVDAKNKVAKTPKSLFYLMCERALANKTDLLILMNQQDLGSAKRYKLSGNIGFTFGMGLAPQRYSKPTALETAQAKKNIGIADKDVVFLCVGEFSKRKNQRQILIAFSQLHKRLPNTALVFAGGGELLRVCKSMAEELQLGDKVIFCGHVQDIGRLYAIADILVTASRCEGLPFCVMEGLLFGLPVIASRIKGHTDLVRDECNGLLYDALNTAQLTDCMARLAGDADYRQKLRGNASLPRQYCLDAVQLKMIDLLGEAIPVHSVTGGIA